MNNNQTILIINLNNNQTSYAQCLDVIESIESLKNEKNANERYELLLGKMNEYSKTSHKDIRVTFSLNDLLSNASKKYLEEPLYDNNNNKVEVVQTIEHNERRERMINSALSGNVQYHLRVHFSKENDNYVEFPELHYLGMLLSYCKDKLFLENGNNFSKKISVFLVPTTGDFYPFKDDAEKTDYELYQKASNYLRLITKSFNGVVFGATNNKDKPTVKALEFKSFLKGTTEFPLMIVETGSKKANIDYLDKSKQNRELLKKNKDSIDNYSLLFNNEKMPNSEIIIKAFNYRTSNTIPFNFASDEDPNIALADMILDASRDRLLNAFANITDIENKNDSKTQIDFDKNNIRKHINTILRSLERTDRFTFALFSFMLNFEDYSENEINKRIYETGKLATDLSSGIKQLVQNSLQHSDSHKCFVTLYKTFNNKLYINITDLNNTTTITENFILGLENEKNGLQSKKNINKNMIDGYNQLLQAKEKIKVKNLFSIFDNDTDPEAWFLFRRSDISAHIGLTLFSQIARRCKAEIIVISNNKIIVDKNNVFTYDYSNNDENTVDNSSLKCVIPGTQFKISIPIEKIQEEVINTGTVQLSSGQNICENYIAYAKYVNYGYSNPYCDKKTLNELITVSKETNITIANEKFELQMMWMVLLEKWISSLETEKLNIFSLKQYSSLFSLLSFPDNCEIAIKGFLSAVIHINKKEEMFLALVDCPICFIKTFKALTSSNLALMKFPENLQLFLSSNNKDNVAFNQNNYQLIFLGNSVGTAVQNSYILSLEHGSKGISSNEYKFSINIMGLFEKQVLADVNSGNIGNYLVMPFTSLININDIPIYFDRLKQISEMPMINRNENNISYGYKFSNIHMRLGNKVHTEEFYEMSFLFYRTMVSNRVAFHILQCLIKDGSINELVKNNSNIVFYGYASYSQAIVMSLTEMLKQYLKQNYKGIDYQNKVYYASYQYNLQTSSSLANIQVYRNRLDKIDNCKVVQIVPISSTLTTFDKMWSAYYNTFKNEEPQLLANYTVYLVRHKQYGEKDQNLSDIEKKYWTQIDLNKKIIHVNNNRFYDIRECNRINYIMSGGSHWHNPTECVFCFPESVYFEMPLVETDPTSTVPSQQIHLPKATTYSNNDNINRIKSLYGCVYYGHYLRSKNHFQYFINTQEYFAKAEDDIKNWLIEEKKKIVNSKDTKPVLNVIFSPEHNTNVGFSQYVNAYYFNGTAEIISVNEDKQFRSNFVCENDAIKQTISRLFNDFEDSKKPVRFFFVDDNIVSGETYRKAGNLLQSLLPSSYRHIYGTNVFEKCFFLIDRLSNSTKESYIVDPSKNFISYCKINISNMRTHGDSCIGCKLETDANKLFRRSSTKINANHWARKSKDYKVVPFDSAELKSSDVKEPYLRLVISHVIQNKISSMTHVESGEVFDWIISVFSYILKTSNTNFEDIDAENETKELLLDIIAKTKEDKGEVTSATIIGTFIKLLSRPFYTFDYSIKTQIMRIVIIMCEILLSNNNKYDMPTSNHPEHNEICNFYSQKKRWDNAVELSLELKTNIIEFGGEKFLMHFIQEYLFEALADMKSTYLLRKSTLIKVQMFLKNIDIDVLCCKHTDRDCNKTLSSVYCKKNLKKCFLNQYLFNIHRIIDTSSDETRALWMEHLILFGYENTEKGNALIVGNNALYNEIIKSSLSEDKLFKSFCNQIFMQNTRLIFDGLEKIYNSSLTINKKAASANNSNKSLPTNNNSDMANPYFMDNYIESRKYIEDYIDTNIPSINSGELKLFEVLTKNSTPEEDSIIDKRYYDLLRSIKQMISDKYKSVEYPKINIALLTGTYESQSDDKKYVLDIIRTDFEDQYSYNSVEENKIQKWSKLKTIIKQRVNAAKSNISPSANNEGNLEELGYYIEYDNNEEREEYLSEQNKSLYLENSSYHKPFLILKFSNDKCDFNHKLGRHMKPIVDVYIYISFIISDKSKRNIVPWLVARDILSYRNRLLKYFEEDFNSDIIKRNSRSNQEKAILEHEKAVSHSTTTDDSVCMSIFKGVEKDNNEATNEKFLLLRDYTNVTISKLFNRSFHKEEEEADYNIKTPPQDIPRLYLSEDGDGNDLFKRLVTLSDLELFEGNDNRFKWLEKPLKIIFKDLEDASIICCNVDKDTTEYYNLEYMKCVILDILLSAAKSKSLKHDFLQNIKYLSNLQINKNIKGVFKPRCATSNVIYFTRTVTENKDFDYLTIFNSIKQNANLTDSTYEILNQEIQYHLNDPIDYPGGHMSLLTIKRYIEELNIKVLQDKTYFRFCKLDEIKSRFDFVNENDKFWFESNLPILKKEQK